MQYPVVYNPSNGSPQTIAPSRIPSPIPALRQIDPTPPFPKPFSYPHGTYSPYPATTYDSYSKENSSPSSSVQFITLNAGGPFYRKSQEESQEQEIGGISMEEEEKQEIPQIDEVEILQPEEE